MTIRMSAISGFMEDLGPRLDSRAQASLLFQFGSFVFSVDLRVVRGLVLSPFRYFFSLFFFVFSFLLSGYINISNKCILQDSAFLYRGYVTLNIAFLILPNG